MLSPLSESKTDSLTSDKEIVEDPYLNEHDFINAIYTLTSRRAQHQFSKEADLFITELIKVLFVRAEHKVSEILTYILVLYSRYLDFLIENQKASEPLDDEDLDDEDLDEESLDDESLDEETLLDALVAALLVSAKTSISYSTRRFRNLVRKSYINHLNSFYDLLIARMDKENLSHLRVIFRTTLSIGILPGDIRHFRFIYNNFSHMINEDEILFAKALLLIDRCSYLNCKTLNRMESVFLANVQWHVAVLCSEQEFIDFAQQLKNYTRSPSVNDAEHVSANPDEMMTQFERTLQIFGREFIESSSEDFSESTDTLDFDIEEQSASLTYAFKKMSLDEEKLSGSESEEDKSPDNSGFNKKLSVN